MMSNQAVSVISIEINLADECYDARCTRSRTSCTCYVSRNEIPEIAPKAIVPVVPSDCFLLKGPFFRIRQRKYYRARPRSRVHGSLELAAVIFCTTNTPQIALRIAAGADTHPGTHNPADEDSSNIIRKRETARYRARDPLCGNPVHFPVEARRMKR